MIADSKLKLTGIVGYQSEKVTVPTEKHG